MIVPVKVERLMAFPSTSPEEAARRVLLAPKVKVPVPRALLLVLTARTPSFNNVPPEWELLPERVRVPVPDFVSAPTPDEFPLKIVSKPFVSIVPPLAFKKVIARELLKEERSLSVPPPKKIPVESPNFPSVLTARIPSLITAAVYVLFEAPLNVRVPDPIFVKLADPNDPEIIPVMVSEVFKAPKVNGRMPKFTVPEPEREPMLKPLDPVPLMSTPVAAVELLIIERF